MIYAIFKCRQCGQQFRELQMTAEYPSVAARKLKRTVTTHVCPLDPDWGIHPTGIADCVGVMEDE